MPLFVLLFLNPNCICLERKDLGLFSQFLCNKAFIHSAQLNATDFSFTDSPTGSNGQSSPAQIFEETSMQMDCSCYKTESGKGYNLVSTESNRSYCLSYVNEQLNLYDFPWHCCKVC